MQCAGHSPPNASKCLVLSGCQSRVAKIGSAVPRNLAIYSFKTETTASPPLTASAPPGQKSFCTSMINKASLPCIGSNYNASLRSYNPDASPHYSQRAATTSWYELPFLTCCALGHRNITKPPHRTSLLPANGEACPSARWTVNNFKWTADGAQSDLFRCGWDTVRNGPPGR